MFQPQITIIVAVLNNVNGIGRCLDSIANQTYSNIELLIMDGGSVDGTVELLNKNSGIISYWESLSDRGIFHAWNKALLKARGEWIYFLGSDDFLWDNKVIEQYVNYLESIKKGTKIVYGSVFIISSDGALLKVQGEPWDKAKLKFSDYMSIPHQGVMHHRSIFEHYGNFDESFRIVGDYELLLRIFKNEEAQFIPDFIIAGMEYGGIASNRDNTILRLKEDYRARKKNSYKLISFYWIKGYLAASIRLLLVLLFGEINTRKLAIYYGRIFGQPSHWEKIAKKAYGQGKN